MPDRADRRRSLVLMVICLLVGVLGSSVWGVHHHRLGVTDEVAHLDYLDRGAHLHLLHHTQVLGPTTLAITSCRGGEAHPPVEHLTCTDPDLTPADYGLDGLNQLDLHPPVYYLLTGPVALLIDAVTPTSDFLAAGRFTSGIWLGLGLGILLLVLQELRVPRLTACATTAAMLGTPLVLRSGGSVGNDATAVFAGSLMALALLRALTGRWGVWRLFLVATFLVSLRATHLLAVGAVVIAVLLASRIPTAEGRTRPDRQRTFAALALAAGVVAGQVAWLGLRAAITVHDAPVNPLDAIQHADSLTLAQVLGAVRSFWPPLTAGGVYADHSWVGVLQPLLAWTAGFLLLAATVSWFVAWHPGPVLVRRREAVPVAVVPVLAPGVVVAALTGGPLLVVVTFVTANAYFALPARYGLSLLPLVVVCAAVSLGRAPGRRWAEVVLGLSGVLGLVAVGIGAVG